jgi:hypothetical protein
VIWYNYFYTKKHVKTPTKSGQRGVMRGNISQKLQKLNANSGLIRYWLANALVVPFNPFVGSAYLSDLSQIKEERRFKKRLHKSQMKKIYRRRQKEGGNNWKELWEKDKQQLKDLRKMEYIQTPFGVEPKTLNPFGYPPPQVEENQNLYESLELKNQITDEPFVKPNPMNLRILGLIFIFRTYFMRLTKTNSKKGKGHPCWGLIAELLAYISEKYSETVISSWWKKVEKIFEIWNEEAFLDSQLYFYQKNKNELDSQSEKWLIEHSERYREDPLDTDSKTTFSAKKWLKESGIIKK